MRDLGHQSSVNKVIIISIYKMLYLVRRDYSKCTHTHTHTHTHIHTHACMHTHTHTHTHTLMHALTHAHTQSHTALSLSGRARLMLTYTPPQTQTFQISGEILTQSQHGSEPTLADMDWKMFLMAGLATHSKPNVALTIMITAASSIVPYLTDKDEGYNMLYKINKTACIKLQK